MRPYLNLLKVIRRTVGTDMHYVSIDQLVVENKAHAHHSAAQWKDLLLETTSRLSSVSEHNDIWVICAIGLRYMQFYWDHGDASKDAIGLKIHVQGEGNGQMYRIPSQLRPMRPAPHLPK